MHKRLIITFAVTFIINFTTTAQTPASKIYENWPSNDQEWNALTNHIMWCYNSLRDRECVATGRTNNFVGDGINDYYQWKPSLVCPFRDYSLIAQNIDRLAPYFVNHTLAGSNGDFSAYFSATNSTGRCPFEFPRWTPEALRSNAFGRLDWSTNSVLTVWMSVTNRAFIAEVTAAINMLKWTSSEERFPSDGDPINAGSKYGLAHTNASLSTAINILLAEYQNLEPGYGINSFGVDNGPHFDNEIHLFAHMSFSYGYAFHAEYIMYGKAQEGNPFVFRPQVSAYARRQIGWYGYEPSDRVKGRRNVFFCADLGAMQEDSTIFTYENPIADLYVSINNPLSYAELNAQLFDNASYNEDELQPLLLVKWDFGATFPNGSLPSSVPIETPDTDIDGIVQTMSSTRLAGSETGTFVVNAYDESPILYLPLSTVATWDGALPVHAYLSQGSVTNLPYQFYPWWPERGSCSPIELLGAEIPILSLYTFHYSLNTCILDVNMVTNAQTHVKQAAILRPRGEVVVFDFPWDGTAFSKKGYPTGVNKDLGYVLYYEESTSNDDIFSLVFPSGMGHMFSTPRPNGIGINMSLLGVFNEDGVGRTDSAPIGVSFYDYFRVYGSFTQEVACVTGGIYRATVMWEKGLPTQVTYQSAKTNKICENVTLNYKDGRVVWLDKTDTEAEAKIQMDNSVLYGTGVKRARAQAGTRKTGRTTTITTFKNEETTIPYLTETTIYDNHQRLSNRTLVAGSQSTSYGYTYKNESATDERYPETGCLIRNSVDKYTKTGCFGSFNINYQYTTQQGWPSNITYSIGGGVDKETLLEYHPVSANTEVSWSMLLKGRRLKSTEQRQDNLSISKTLHANKTADPFYYPRDEKEICYAPNATWGDVKNHKYNVEIGIYNDGFYSLATGFRMYQCYFKTPAAEWSCYNYNNTGTEAFFEIESESTYKDVIVNARGVPLYSKTTTKEGVILDESVTLVDIKGRPEYSCFMDGTSILYMDYCIHGPQTIFNRDDSMTTIEYDPFGRVKKRVDGETGITYEYEYDPNGNVLKQTRSSGTLKAESFATYGLDGELLYSKDESGHEVSITGQNNNGYQVLTRMETGMAPVTETYWADGVLKSVAGAGAPVRFNRERGVTNNKYWVKTVNPDNPNEWSTQWHNYNGLYAYTEQPRGMTNAVAYDAKLRPKADVSADKVKSLAAYDAKYPGLLSVSGVSLSGSDQIDLTSDPYCVSNSYAFTSQGLKTTQYSYPEDNSAAPFEEGYTQVSPDGRTGTFCVQGRTGTFSCDAAPSTGTFQKTVNLPGGGIATYTYSKFLLREETLQEAGTFRKVIKTYQYDKFNRMEAYTTDERGFKETVKVTRDPAKGLVSNINSSSQGSISITRENDLVKKITAPSGTTTFGWKGNGSIDSVRQDLGPTFSRTEDAFGRDKSLTRQNEGLSSVLDFSYGNDGGFEGKKRDNVPKISVTSRRADGRPKVTVLPDGITVTTDFDDAGRESGQTWTDPANPSATVAFTHSWMRDGSLRRQGQVGGPFVSNSLIRANGRIASTASSFGCGTNGASVQTSYDATHGAPSLITAQFNGFTNMNLSATAAHDTFGYLSALSGDGFTNVFSCATGGMITNTLASIGAIFQLRRSVIWSAQAGKLARVDYTLNGQFLRRWQYTFTNGLVSSVSRSGGDSYRTAYTYDNAKQLIGATSSTTNGLALPGLSFAYEYTLAGDTFKYGRTALQNTAVETLDDLQTTRIWQPYVHLLGRVSDPNATVLSYTSYKTNRFPATVTAGLYYSTPVLDTLPNTIPTSGVATVIATLPSGTSETARVVFSLPASYEVPVYNGRGMILSDSRRQYIWDAAERLISISNSGVSNAVKLAFQYYPDGRRAQKTVSCFTNNAWVVTCSLHYAWQGWKLAAECERNGAGAITAVRHFVWGPDIGGQQSASLDSGAEGVGGLMLIREWKPVRGMKQYLPLTDGLGNISGLIDATDGSLAAEYDYDPYGGPIIERGIATDACPFRHRTRYYDSESWLYYYGYRYYDPCTTKWISKDPLEEEGGWNLTCFCGNDPINEFDPLGLAGYFFGGTSNSLDEEGISNVEIIYKAWNEDINGKAFYVPGVYSGYLPNGSKETNPWLPRMQWLWLGPLYGIQGEYASHALEGTVGKSTDRRVDQMTKYLEHQLKNKDKTVNVFGFSRGATSSLEFLNRIQDQIKARNPLYRGVKINYVALWDTVKSTAINYRTELPKGMQFQHKPLHFIAIDEGRADFYNKEVLNVQGALQIGFRGVHADAGNGYRGGALGWPSLEVAVRAGKMIGLQFNNKTLDRYAGTYDPNAKPTPNSRWFYREGGRVFPQDMYLDPSVGLFNMSSQPINDISNQPVLPENALLKWKRKNSYFHK